MIFNHSTASILDNVITQNLSQAGGGGIFVGANSLVIIRGNQITHNQAGFGGGIFMEIESTLIIEDNLISHNSAGLEGGGGPDPGPGRRFRHRGEPCGPAAALHHARPYAR